MIGVIMVFGKELSLRDTGIPGLTLVDLTVHGDNRGWFKENWQRQKMCALGIPDRRWVQNNISFNDSRGVARGFHAEPWDKWISVACGSIFGAWVDLRAGSETFGKVFTATLSPSNAIYVPRGVANSYQALEDGTTYTYLVDAHWSLELKPSYTFVNLADPQLAVEWPIPLTECELSEADKSHPFLSDVKPMLPRRTLVTGCNGQLGRAVREEAELRGISTFDYTDIDVFDFSDTSAYDSVDWTLYGTVINCGAYTAVDRAETTEGRVAAWKANGQGPSLLSKVCLEHDIVLVHISSDYVFDGTHDEHAEDEPFSPLGVYGQSKAAGDMAVCECPSHYVVRSSWVVGDGNNFVKTMIRLSDRCADPDDSLSSVTVVKDQLGRLTFTDQMAKAIFHLLGYVGNCPIPTNPAAFGTYNLTNDGPVASWYDIAVRIFAMRNNNGYAVVPVSTVDYYAKSDEVVSPRPAHSALSLRKICDSGFKPTDWDAELVEYVNNVKL